MFWAPLVVAPPAVGVRHAELDLVEHVHPGECDLNGHKQEMVLSGYTTETNLVGSFTEGTTHSPEQYVAPTVKGWDDHGWRA